MKLLSLPVCLALLQLPILGCSIELDERSTFLMHEVEGLRVYPGAAYVVSRAEAREGFDVWEYRGSPDDPKLVCNVRFVDEFEVSFPLIVFRHTDDALSYCNLGSPSDLGSSPVVLNSRGYSLASDSGIVWVGTGRGVAAIRISRGRPYVDDTLWQSAPNPVLSLRSVGDGDSLLMSTVQEVIWWTSPEEFIMWPLSSTEKEKVVSLYEVGGSFFGIVEKTPQGGQPHQVLRQFADWGIDEDTSKRWKDFDLKSAPWVQEVYSVTVENSENDCASLQPLLATTSSGADILALTGNKHFAEEIFKKVPFFHERDPIVKSSLVVQVKEDYNIWLATESGLRLAVRRFLCQDNREFGQGAELIASGNYTKVGRFLGDRLFLLTAEGDLWLHPMAADRRGLDDILISKDNLSPLLIALIAAVVSAIVAPIVSFLLSLLARRFDRGA